MSEEKVCRENQKSHSVYFYQIPPHHFLEDSGIFPATRFVFVVLSFLQSEQKKFCDVTVQFVGLETSEVSVTRRKLVQCGRPITHFGD
jgi:hypothetical protein